MRRHAGDRAAVFEGALRGARIVVVGVCMEHDRIEPFFAIQKKLELQFVLGYTPEEFARTLQHIAEGRIDVAPLITGRVGIDGIRARSRRVRIRMRTRRSSCSRESGTKPRRRFDIFMSDPYAWAS
jgi:threonine dehydrogenase-like Zn-dependent dehydrogenase